MTALPVLPATILAVVALPSSPAAETRPVKFQPRALERAGVAAVSPWRIPCPENAGSCLATARLRAGSEKEFRT